MTVRPQGALALDSPPIGDSAQMRFERLVRAYSADLYRYAFWLRRDQSSAEDLVQETLLRAWRALESMRDEGAAKAWLLAILRREHARQFGRYRPTFDDVETENLPAWDNDDKRAEAVVLRRAVARLPIEYREPLVLQVLGGYSTAEIGALLNLSRGAVMTRVFRAKHKLRRILEGETP